MLANYPLPSPRDSSRDYLTTGELSPILYVSGGRMRRDLTLDSAYAGSIYVESEGLIGPEASLIKRRKQCYFSLAPYERNHLNPDFIACGENGGCSIFPFNQHTGDSLSDYELWNMAAAALHQASDQLTLRYASPLAQFRKGRWKCGYVGNSGRDTVWHRCKTISPGLLRSAASSRAHFVATDNNGARYRIVPQWQTLPDTMGQHVGLTTAAIHLGGPIAKLPRYLLDWVESRIEAKS